MNTKRPLQERYWEKVIIPKNRNDCWLWAATTNTGGYGMIHLNETMKSAHIVAWFLSRGEWPKNHILHTCDNPPCQNPSHLFEGTPSDNAKDREKKGRGWKGGTKGNNRGSSLSDDEVREIRKLAKTEPAKQIGWKYRISESYVRQIYRRERLAYVPD